ncbi:MAG: PucR family transcriptional regulator [Bacillota bacterium]
MKKLIGLRVKDVFKFEIFDQLELSSGHGGLNRNVSGVLYQSLKDNENDFENKDSNNKLLLCDCSPETRDFFSVLNKLQLIIEKNSISAVLIRTEEENNFADILSLCEEKDIPAAFVPLQIDNAELFESFTEEMIKRHNRFRERSISTFQSLFKYIKTEGNLPELINKISEFISNPVLIIDQHDNIIEKAGFENDAILNSALKSLKNEKKSHIQSRKIFLEKFIISGQERKRLAAKVNYFDEDNIYLYVWDFETDFDEIDKTIFETAAVLAELSFFRQKSVKEIEYRYENEMIYELVKGKFNSEDEFRQNIKVLNWNLKDNYRIILFDLKKLISSMIRNNKKLPNNFQRQLINNALNVGRKGTISGDLGRYVVVIYPEEENNKNDKEKIKEYIAEILNNFSQEERKLIIVGVGDFRSSLKKIHESYEQAKQSINVAYKISDDRRNIFFYSELGVYRLLYNVDENDFSSFLANTISPLIEYDREHNTELLKTLKVYFEENANLTNLSKKMYIHYNTALYRLQRIEKITGFNISDSEDRLNLEIAVKMLQINENFNNIN